MMYLGEIKRHWFVLIAVIAAVAIIIFVLNPQLLEKYAGARITAVSYTHLFTEKTGIDLPAEATPVADVT